MILAEKIMPMMRKVSMEEANTFLKVKEETAKYIALGVLLCIISPITLFLPGGCSDAGMIGENIAAGIGLITLLLLVATAVVIFLFCGAKTDAYTYLETEIFETEYGVNGMVKERQKRYSNIFGNCRNSLGKLSETFARRRLYKN